MGGKIQLFDAETWQPLTQWTTAPFPSAIAFAPDGQTFALATVKGIWLLDLRQPQPLAQLPPTNIRQLAFCAQGQLLLTSSREDQPIGVWDVAKRQQIAQWALPERVFAFAVAPQESFALAVTQTGNAYTWPLPKDRDALK
jgi:WD40 repeat protein